MKYGGLGRTDMDYRYLSTPGDAEKKTGFEVYIPARTMMVFEKVD